MELTLALAQYPITCHRHLQDWAEHTTNWVKDAKQLGADLLVFPEYASLELVSIFSAELQSDLRGQLDALQVHYDFFTNTYRTLALQHGCMIVAPSFPWRNPQGRYLNRNWVFSPQGEGFQDKWFMTRFESETWGVEQPEHLQYTVFETTWGCFGIQICFDIEFPLGVQHLAQNGVDLILAPSCTDAARGAARVHVGARARALEQQVFVGVSQTIGSAPWSPAIDLNYGYAALYAAPDVQLPEDGIISSGLPNQAGWHIQKIDFALLRQVREDAQVFTRKAMQTITMHPSGAIVRVRL